ERKMLSVVKEVAEKAGITKNATLHKWRHSFNSHLSQMGVDYSVRQYLMGHKPQTMTDHYTKVDPKKLHSEVSKLDALIP
ncbi:MAG: tyrosine-type recombinase/integrase, partial [Bacillota bacterium]